MGLGFGLKQRVRLLLSRKFWICDDCRRTKSTKYATENVMCDCLNWMRQIKFGEEMKEEFALVESPWYGLCAGLVGLFFRVRLGNGTNADIMVPAEKATDHIRKAGVVDVKDLHHNIARVKIIRDSSIDRVEFVGFEV